MYKTIISIKGCGLFLRKKERPFEPFIRCFKEKYIFGYRGIEFYIGEYFFHLIYKKLTHRR